MEEDRYIRRNSGKKTYVQIAADLARPVELIRRRAHKKLALRKRKLRLWTKTEREFLRRLYRRMSAEEIAKKLRRSVYSIYTRARDEGIRTWRSPRFTEKEKRFVRTNYYRMLNRELASALGRNIISIDMLAGRLGLTNDPRKQALYYKRIQRRK